MARYEQNIRWGDLSKEEQKSARRIYKHLTRLLDTAKSNTQTEHNIMAFALEHTFGSHNLKPKLTYEDVVKELGTGTFKEFNKKLEAIGKLMAVAKYLNKNKDGSDWVPDWEKVHDDKERIYGIGIDPSDNNEVRVFRVNPERLTTEVVYFRTEALAKQAIEILGEDVIRTAFGNY